MFRVLRARTAVTGACRHEYRDVFVNVFLANPIEEPADLH